MINEVICGDCLEGMKLIPDNAIDLVLTDPPYNQKYHYDKYSDALQDAEYIDFMKGRIKKPCVIINYPENIIKYFVPFLGVPDEIVAWVYNAHTPKKFRLICWWGIKPNFNRIKQPFKNPKEKRILNKEGASLYDWWQIEQVKNVSKEKTDHPCQIPLELIKRIITLTTDKGNLICDPFMGSWTTARACKDLGRDFIGFELSEDYCKIGESRLAQMNLF